VVVSNSLGSFISAPIALLTVAPAAPGSVVAWGNDRWGQTDVPLAAQSGVTSIAAGAGYTVALKTDGSLLVWGNQTNVPPAAQSGVTAMAASMLHIAALKTDSTVLAWGNNYYGQVTGTPTPNEPRFRIASPVTLEGQVLSNVTAIAASSQHTVALKNDGTVVAWGWNQYGQATAPPGLSGVAAIAAGGGHTVALKTDGSVVAWGDDEFGQTTVPIGARSAVRAIAAGYGHTVALKNDGSVLAWGLNSSGQTSVPVAAQSGVTAIATVGYHTVALKSDGSVLAWGAGSSNTGFFAEYGQSLVPGAVQSGVTAIAAGWDHTVAILGRAVALQVSLTGTGLSLSWPANDFEFTLQSTPSLTPPVVWNDVMTVPAAAGTQLRVSTANFGGGQFYRLVKP
jgi:alpha-tubulin suppressor-like RCC1 family protein